MQVKAEGTRVTRYICVYICMYVCMYIYTHTHIYIYASLVELKNKKNYADQG